MGDCKTSGGGVPERLFWLSGVSAFFSSDTSLLVRSAAIPEHAAALARTLSLSLVGPRDLEILQNTYIRTHPLASNLDWADFHSAAVQAETLYRVRQLPPSLRSVERYRSALFWMEPQQAALMRVVAALQQLSAEGSRGPVFKLVFGDFVWLYVVALWRALQAIVAGGVSDVEEGLFRYLSGYETGLSNLERWKRSFEGLAKRVGVEVALPLKPPYFRELLDLVVRCLRRPDASVKMARRAEWLVAGQMIGRLGQPPWPYGDDDLIADKLLDDVAAFLVRASKLADDFYITYSGLLRQDSLLERAPGPQLTVPESPTVQLTAQFAPSEHNSPEQTSGVDPSRV